jgi:hypothetical protein
MKIVVKKVKTGWIVHDGTEMGPFTSRQRAMDLAEGMVIALREHVGDVELVIDEGSSADVVAES